jgi:hypothetical protein
MFSIFFLIKCGGTTPSQPFNLGAIPPKYMGVDYLYLTPTPSKLPAKVMIINE